MREGFVRKGGLNDVTNVSPRPEPPKAHRPMNNRGVEKLSDENPLIPMGVKEFRESGLLWFINMQLHAFGVALSVDIDEDGNETSLKPNRTIFRGFSEECNSEGYKKVTTFMKKRK